MKDNIDTADKMATTAGSLALVGSKPKQDAFIVKKLRDAGAVILGKTNLSEWANIRCSTSTSGWSARGGQTRNPYALDRNPSGSSSGSGVAVSSNLCAAAIGTETDGSILSPSSVSGIVGIKPTVGLVSRSGIIPISHNQDTAGPMCRSVRDAAMMLDAIAGPDLNDTATAANARMNARAYVTNCDPNGLQGARIGVARNYFGFHEAVDAVMAQALDAMKKMGAVLVDPAEIPNIAKVGEFEDTVLLYDLKHDLNAYLANLGGHGAGPHAEGHHRIQRAAQSRRNAVFRPRPLHQVGGEGPADDAGICRRSRQVPEDRPRRRESTPSWISTSSTRSSRRPTARRG